MRAHFLPAAILQALLAIPPAYLGLIYASLALDPPPCSFLCFGPEFFLLWSGALLGLGVLLASLGWASVLGVRWAGWTSLVASLALAGILFELASNEVDEGWVSVGVTAIVLRSTAVLALSGAAAMAAAMLLEKRAAGRRAARPI